MHATNMHSEACNLSAAYGDVEITLDGQRVGLPPHRRSLTAIRSYLERIAFEQQRILWGFNVDGAAAGAIGGPVRVTAQTASIGEMPRLLVETALQQAVQAYGETQNAVSQVMINEAPRARELWWGLTQLLKQPLLTLSLLPETAWACPAGSASPKQLRCWQFQQVASIISDVDTACSTDDPLWLSNALEERVLPWLESFIDLLELLRNTMLEAPGSAPRAGVTAGKTPAAGIG